MQPEKKSIIISFLWPLVFVSLLWLIKSCEILFSIDFVRYGIMPRHVQGLAGIVTSPLIHGDFEHLISNSIPLLILGTMLFYFYKEFASKVFFYIYLLSGFWLWLGGRESYHIGASGIVYGLVAFLFLSGIFRRHTGLMALSLLVVFLYGSIIWGIFPIFKERISWEAHLFGLLAGVIIAVAFRKEGPQRKVYDWEEEEDDETNDYLQVVHRSEMNEENKENPVGPQQPKTDDEIPSIRYVYQKKKEDDNDDEQSDLTTPAKR